MALAIPFNFILVVDARADIFAVKLFVTCDWPARTVELAWTVPFLILQKTLNYGLDQFLVRAEREAILLCICFEFVCKGID